MTCIRLIGSSQDVAIGSQRDNGSRDARVAESRMFAAALDVPDSDTILRGGSKDLAVCRRRKRPNATVIVVMSPKLAPRFVRPGLIHADPPVPFAAKLQSVAVRKGK